MVNERIKAARKMAGLSLEELAAKMGDITRQALNNYEMGKRKPDSNVIIKLARAIGVKPDYFSREYKVLSGNFEYRKSSKLNKKQMASIEEKTKDHLERYLELEAIMGMKSQFVNPLDKNEVKNEEGAENKARMVREKWELGNEPIKNLIETLEGKNIRVFEIVAGDKFDGLALHFDGIPVIVVNKNKYDAVRKRLTVAHELGHLLLKISKNISDRDKERICYRFAAALLIPSEVMFEELGKSRTSIMLNELEHLKKEYGISIQALMRRARDLGIITSRKYQAFCMRIKKEGWQKFEGEEYEGEDKPIKEKNLLYRAISEEIISISKAASLANVAVAELEEEIEPIV